MYVVVVFNVAGNAVLDCASNNNVFVPVKTLIVILVAEVLCNSNLTAACILEAGQLITVKLVEELNAHFW